MSESLLMFWLGCRLSYFLRFCNGGYRPYIKQAESKPQYLSVAIHVLSTFEFKESSEIESEEMLINFETSDGS